MCPTLQLNESICVVSITQLFYSFTFSHVYVCKTLLNLKLTLTQSKALADIYFFPT